MVTHEEQPSRAAPAIPGHPLEGPLTVREAVSAGIGLAGEAPGALTARTLHSAAPRTRRDDVPRSLERLLADCLSKSPEQRPGSAAAGTVPRPIVTAKRLGTSVEFRWRASDVPRAGDSFRWRLPSRGGTHLTTGPSVTIRSPARLCLQVRLAQAGLPPSPYAAACGWAPRPHADIGSRCGRPALATRDPRVVACVGGLPRGSGPW